MADEPCAIWPAEHTASAIEERLGRALAELETRFPGVPRELISDAARPCRVNVAASGSVADFVAAVERVIQSALQEKAAAAGEARA